MTTETIESPLARLSDEQIEQLGKEFDAIHDEVFDDLGERDAKYIRSMIEMHRRLVVMGRLELLGSRFPPLWLLGTASLSAAKILENMEIGHNVMHGQWDWMNNPEIHSETWDWDTASTKEAWKHSHNYVHHTYTNIRGKDKDLGYEIMRIDPHQKWYPFYLLQPIYNVVLMALFEWGVAFHDLDFEAIRKGEKSKEQVREELKGIAGKARTQIVKDYVAFPALSGLVAGGVAAAGAALKARGRGRIARRRHGTATEAAVTAFTGEFKRSYRSTLRADAVANVVRNFWSNAIIFCGHFPDQTYTFSEEEVEDESKGGWYVRQLLGAANIEGGGFFHVASGNLGYQVEHHLYPDMPSSRYGEIAPKVRDVCRRYGLPYNTGPFSKQWGSVQRTILRLAFPGGKPRPKPGPYRGTDTEAAPAASSNGASYAASHNGDRDSGQPAATENVAAEGPGGG
ncbi:MAG: NADPH-dependent stearoyl-CoA 9-desaturase [Solirubrobacterales bacterium]|jgi:linoleoyl-CoA desaturase|nr:NADPH-dependent stearoyl-CoA 9-desaturase [Solirubrobacterales bacterium]